MENKKLFAIKSSMDNKDYHKFLYIATFIRKKFMIPTIVVVTFLMAAFVSYSNNIFQIKSFFIYWIILLIITLFAIIIKLEFQNRERAKKDEDGVFKATETLEFFENEVTIKSTAFKGKSKIKYYKIYEVLETKNYFIIYFNRKQASIIKKSNLDEKTLSSLKDLLCDKIGNKYKSYFK